MVQVIKAQMKNQIKWHIFNISIVDLCWGLGVQNGGLEVWVWENLTPASVRFYLWNFYLKSVQVLLL